jgi:Tol biopolymer transport system component
MVRPESLTGWIVARFLCLVPLVLAGTVTSSTAQGLTSLASQAPGGLPATADNAAISLSGRYVVFRSASDDLAGLVDFNEIFLLDRVTGAIERISKAADVGTAPANNNSNNPTVSLDGRYVAFQSNASNLVAGDTNDQEDIFVRDRQTNVTTRVSVSSAGAQANGFSIRATISSDGRFVVFASNATNLVAGDTNAQTDVFLRHLQNSTTIRVSVSSSGAQANGASFQSSISFDGAWVAFESDATNLVAGDTNAKRDVFLYGRLTGAVTRLSLASNGAEGNGDSSSPVISADGSTIAFVSTASNLVSDFNAAIADVFVHVRATGQTSCVSVGPPVFSPPENPSVACGGANAMSNYPSISADGTVVAFASDAMNMVEGDENNKRDVFVRDRTARTIRRVSVASNGTEGNGAAFDNPPEVQAYISGDGRLVAFHSDANNLLAAGEGTKVFVHDRQPFGTAWITPTANLGSFLSDDGGAISSDGRFVAFASNADSLVPGDTNNAADVFLQDRYLGTLERVSVATDGTQAIGGSSVDPMVAADGTAVFGAIAGNLVPGDTNGTHDVFVRDAQTHQTSRINVRPDGAQADASALGGRISHDGRFVAFHSSASDLVPGDTNGVTDVFLRDRQTSTTIRVSVASNGSQASNGGSDPSLANGGTVAFASASSDLVANDTNGFADIFVREPGGALTLVSVSTSGAQANSGSGDPKTSADGQFVVFVSGATNLDENVPDTNGHVDIFVRDRQQATTKRVNVKSQFPGTYTEANGSSSNPSISDDGRYIVFQSDATNLVATADTNETSDIFRHDTVTGETILVSVNRLGGFATGTSGSRNTSISGDGRSIVFESDATNFVTGDNNSHGDIYARFFAPTLTGVSPITASAAGGTTITLTGADFHPGAQVTVGGSAATSVAVANTTTATAATPAGPVGPTTVTFRTLEAAEARLFGLTLSGSQPFTDGVLTAGASVIRAVHITELRTRIAALRAKYGLVAFAWTDSSLAAGTTAQAVHVTELRTALQQAYAAAGPSAPALSPFTDSTLVPQSTLIKAAHIQELRNAVFALEGS